MTRDMAIAHIDAKVNSFFTVDRVSGKRAYIGVGRETGKAPYLRTYADGVWNDNLLALAEWGSTARSCADFPRGGPPILSIASPLAPERLPRVRGFPISGLGHCDSARFSTSA